MTAARLGRDAVIVACAVSAGIHAALAPEHFREGRAAGGGFVAAALLLGALAVVLTLWPGDVLGIVSASLVFAGLLASYVLVITAGVPLLHPEIEPVNRLAAFTKAVEVVGLVTALYVLRREGATHALRPKGLLT